MLLTNMNVISPIDLLNTAKENGIDVFLDEGKLQLKVSRDKKIDKDLLEEIKSNRESIIEFISTNRHWNNNGLKINKTDKSLIDRIPLSFSQERLWFIDRLEGSLHYHTPAIFRLKGKINKAALEHSLKMIVNRHEVLRTVIMDDGGEAYQHIKEKDSLKLAFIDGSQYQHDAGGLRQYINGLIRQPFDLSKDDMIRAHLITFNEYEQILILNIHHIASDAWSMKIFIKELVALYDSYIENRPADLPPLDVQYADYALWQHHYLQGEQLNNRLSYWKKKLHGVAPLQLPTDYSRPAVQGINGSVSSFHIDKDISEMLQQLSNKQGATLFMTLISAFKVLMHRYSGQQDICVGIPIAGRQQDEIQPLIGFFVNTLALRSEANSDLTFIEFLQQVKTTTLEAYEHQDAPFEKVVNAVAKERGINRSPIFQVMFIWQNTSKDSQQRLHNVELLREDYEHTTAKFDLIFGLNETADGLEGAIEYSTDLYNEQTVERMATHFNKLIYSIVKNPDQKLGKLPMLTHAEERQLLVDFNNTEVPYAKDKTIADLFEEQVIKTPDNIAVVLEEEQLTYNQLNIRANQLAHYLKSWGVKEQTLVPIFVERSLQMIVGVLAILKAGGAYVPIDPEYPQDRINYLIEDTAGSLILTDRKSREKLQLNKEVEIIEMESDWINIEKQPVDNLKTKLPPNALVYIIYTSGSTGKPKGVRMPGSGLLNLLLWQQKQFKNKNRRVLQFASLNFDVSFQDIFSTICFGSSLYLIRADRRVYMPEVIKDIKQYNITHLFIPFIILKNLAEYLLPLYDNSFPLEEILVAGEQLKLTEDIQKLIKKSGIQLINHYGPTEAHVVSSFTINPGAELPFLPPIGKPIDNCRLHILDTFGELIPTGITGELYIGGVQVADGYLNKPELTAKKFIADKFSKVPGARLYRTGDLARWLPRGDIEYLGRIDDQVKIRGFRIELGEIESVVQECELVRQGVVLAKEDGAGNKRLVGYVVPEGEFSKEALISYLETKLPNYMVPAQWVKMQQLPITANGKIDREKLPDPNEILSDQFVAPGSETEKAVADIWKELLNIEGVGVKDNFFELGGHSLMVLQLVERVRKLGIEINAKDLFSYQTIEQQSKFISTSLTLLQTASQGKYIIPIQPEGDNIPVFAFTEFLLYNKVGEHISKNQPFYSIERSPYEKKEDIAAHYISEIKKIYPHGPYCLAGFCRWGGIAVEMAHALRAGGDEVALLILIEYYSPRARRSRLSRKFLAPKMKYSLKTLKENKSLTDKGKYVVEEIMNISQFIHDKLSGRYNESRVSSRTYSGNVLLVKASETYGYYENCNMGWSKNFIGEVENITIEGDHLNIMRNPAAAELGEKLNKILEKTNNKYKSKPVNGN